MELTLEQTQKLAAYATRVMNGALSNLLSTPVDVNTNLAEAGFVDMDIIQLTDELEMLPIEFTAQRLRALRDATTAGHACGVMLDTLVDAINKTAEQAAAKWIDDVVGK
jgi:hypothetical protein